MAINHRIPPEIFKDIIEVIEHIEKFLPFCPSKHQTYLFEVYNKYIAPKYDQQKETCGGCRALVIGKMRTLARQWKQQETNL